MMQLVTSGNFDQNKASAIVSQEAQVHMQMQLEHLKIASQIYGVLDSNQKSQVTDLIAQHQQRMQEHMQKTPSICSTASKSTILPAVCLMLV